MPSLDENTIDEDAFIKAIHSELKAGNGFIPLLGSGISFAAGIPLIRQLSLYLESCIGMALNLDTPGMRTWNPSRDNWPAFASTKFLKTSTIDRLQGEMMSAIRKGDFDKVTIYQSAIGALTDWRSSLRFMAKLKLHKKDALSTSQGYYQEIGPLDTAVIDSFFRYITYGKQPALAHRMLALSSDLLRFQIVLTTNFDDLFEKAAEDASRPVTVYDVHMDASIPSSRLVESGRSLIKLHGGRYGLRADESLDEDPPKKEIDEFTSYFSDPESWNNPDFVATKRRQLLVMGCGAQDNRVNAFIRGAMENDVNLQVFWVCYFKNEIKNVRDVILSKSMRNPDRLKILHHKSPGLLLAQVYQSLVLALPSSRVKFPSTAEVAFPPLPFYSINPRGNPSSSPDVHYSKIKDMLEEPPEIANPGRLIVLTNTPSGLENADFSLSGCSFEISHTGFELFEYFSENRCQCVWIDMDEISSLEDLFEQILETIAQKMGIHEWRPMVGDDHEARSREFERITRSSKERWIIFLYARDGAGANKKRCHDPFQEESERWITDDKLSPGDDWLFDRSDSKYILEDNLGSKPEELIQLLWEIRSIQSIKVDIVLMCRNGELVRTINNGHQKPKDNTDHKLHKFQGNKIEEILDTDSECLRTSVVEFFDRPKESEILLDGKKVRERVLSWLDEAKHVDEEYIRRIRFLYGLCLFRQTRYPSALLTWALCPLNQSTLDQYPVRRLENRQEFTQKCLSKLMEEKLIRRKTGGFIWMHRWIREEIIRTLLLNSYEKMKVKQDWFNDGRLAIVHTQQIHHGLAEWHWKLFLSSKDPQALCESVYHRCWNAEAAFWSAAMLVKTKTHEKDRIQKYILRAVVSIKQAADSIFRGSDYLNTTFRSRAACRMLTFIRLQMALPLKKVINSNYAKAGLNESQAVEFDNACNKLLQACLKVQLAIAREVSEHLIAFQRLTQIANNIIPGLEESDKPFKAAEQIRKEISNLKFGSKTKTIDISQTNIEIHLNWMYECGVLSEATRGYKKSESIFLFISRALGIKLRNIFNKDDRDRTPANQFLDTLRKNWKNISSHERWEKAVILSKTLRRLMFIKILRAEACFLNESRKVKGNLAKATATRNKYLNQAESYKRMAVEALRFLEETKNPGKYLSENCRILTHLSIVKAHQNDFKEAERRLTEAASNITKSDATGHKLTLGVIDLHRAEVRCIQVANMHNFAKWRNDWLYSNYGYLKNALNIDSLNLSNLGPIHGLLDEAQEALDRAKSRLSSARNVWWICNYYFLKLKVIELQLTLNIADRGSVIPGFGLEAAPRNSLSEPESLMNDLGRMVRRDVLAYARGLECFLRMYRLLQIKLEAAPIREKLPQRIEACFNAIQYHRKELHGRLLERKYEIPYNNPTLDNDIAEYVEHVLSMASQI